MKGLGLVLCFGFRGFRGFRGLEVKGLGVSSVLWLQLIHA